jgi:hypothetical protein
MCCFIQGLGASIAVKAPTGTCMGMIAEPQVKYGCQRAGCNDQQPALQKEACVPLGRSCVVCVGGGRCIRLSGLLHEPHRLAACLLCSRPCCGAQCSCQHVLFRCSNLLHLHLQLVASCSPAVDCWTSHGRARLHCPGGQIMMTPKVTCRQCHCRHLAAQCGTRQAQFKMMHC